MSSLQSFSDSIIDQHNVPAVSLAVWNNAELNQAASGLLNLETGVEATTDSVFQIGSITKVMTTCLVMQLVDEGRVDLDTPVKHYLRDFMIADAKHQKQLPCGNYSIIPAVWRVTFFQMIEGMKVIYCPLCRSL